MSESISKIKEYVQQIDKQLTSDHSAKWGLMNAQQMVEHLSLLFMASMGKWGKSFTGDAEKAAKMKANFFAVKYPFPKGVLMPGAKKGEVTKPRFETIEESKAMLKKSANTYFDYFAANPKDEVQHPYFGMLSFEDWNNFHRRHIEHHLMQFDLRPYPLTPEMEGHLAQIEEKLQKVYTALTADHSAKWGMMNAHEMVEHLTFVFPYSTGKFGIPFKGDVAKAKAMWAPFVTTTSNPWKTVFPQINFTKEPPKLRTETIDIAKRKLKKSFIKYTHWLKENPTAITPHGFLGDITAAQWLQVHSRHLDHHLSQFGVIEELV